MTTLALLLWLCALPLAAQPPGLEIAGPSVRVGVYENSPKIGLGEDGQPQGIFVDLIEAIGEREGWQFEYVFGTWQEGLNRLATGRIDLMPDVAYSTERAELYSFHEEPALSSWHQIYAPKDSGIRSLLDLDGRRLAVLAGSVQENQLQKLIDGFATSVDMQPYPDYASAFEAARGDEVDAVVTNRFYGERHAAEFGLEDTAVIFAPSRLFFAAPLTGRQHLLDAIDRHLVAFKQDPDSPYFKTIERWIDGPGLTEWPDWLPYALAAAVIMLGGSLALVLVLRSQVRARTRQVHDQARSHTRELEQRVQARTRQLQEASTFLQSLIDHIPSLIYYKDSNLRFTGCNRAYERAFGLNREDIKGKTVHELSYLPETDRDRYDLEQRQLLELGGSIRREVTLDFADGTRHQMLYSAARIQGAECQRLGIVGLLVDITHQKRVEAELSEARDEARTADRVKSAFLATMSHELRTPLNSIIGFTGILLQQLAGPLNDEQTRQLEMVRNSSRHLLTLINDILDISRIEAGEMTLDTAPFSVTESIENVAGILRPQAEQKGVALDVAIGVDPGLRSGDRRRVEQILFNLVGNAIKFTESGAVEIGVEVAGAKQADEGMVVFQVRDSGIGIRDADMKSLFLPFRQIDSTLSRKHEGTGLGLTICKRLVDLMGGDIEVASRWGVGTTFTVRLPLAAAGKGQ